MRFALALAAVLITVAFVSDASASELQNAIDLCKRASERPTVISTCSIVIGLSKDQKLLERAYNRRGMAEEQIGQFDLAASDYTSVIHLNPTIAGYFDNRMRAYKGANHLDLALQDANTAVRMAPTYAFPLHGRGAVYFDTGDYRAAVRDFSAALAIDERDASIHVDRGRAMVKMGDLKGALQDFEAARAIDPANEPALRERGMVYAQIGRTVEARSDLSAAVAINPSDGDATTALQQLDNAVISQDAKAGSGGSAKPSHAEDETAAVIAPVRDSRRRAARLFAPTKMSYRNTSWLPLKKINDGWSNLRVAHSSRVGSRSPSSMRVIQLRACISIRSGSSVTMDQ